MKTRILSSLSIAAVVLFIGAGTSNALSVVTDFVKGAPFEKYKTYAIDLGESPLKESGRTALLAAIRANMAKRGYKEVAYKNADIAIAPIAMATQRTESVPTINNVAVFTPGHTYKQGTWSTASSMRTTAEGTLALDFVDLKWKKELVFRGVAKEVMRDPQSNAAAIREAVAKIVKSFPASPKP